MTAIWVEHKRIQRWVWDFVLVFGYGLIIAISSQFRIHLPFSPVPITAQTLTVLLAGGLLGAKQGGLAALLYLLLGSLGILPFAGGSLLGPTGGYLIGFVVAAFVIGAITSMRSADNWWSTLIVLLVGNGIVYLCGLPWLAMYVGWHSTLLLGLYPFIIGDLLKLICAFGLLRILSAHRGRIRDSQIN